MKRLRVPRASIVVACVLALSLSACSIRTGAEDLRRDLALDPPESGTDSSDSLVEYGDQCDEQDPTRSYAPEGPTPAADSLVGGSTMAQIRDRGTLRVGVSADTRLMGARNPFNDEFEGFDIDVAKEIARGIFGDPDRMEPVVISADQRIAKLQAGEVDLVVRAMTITCDRWNHIALSSTYYEAGQKLLVPQGSSVTGLDLDTKQVLRSDVENESAELRVCAQRGSTTIEELATFVNVDPVEASTHAECLVLFQQSSVDAISADDTILAGFVAQDPYAVVLADVINSEPYGIGVAYQNVDLVRFVNSVLDDMRTDGRWQAIYDRWLRDLGGLGEQSPPVAVYGR